MGAEACELPWRWGMIRLFCLIILALCIRPGPSFAQGAPRRGRDPKILTFQIAQADTVAQLLEVLEAAVDKQIFNDIHASAACTRLASFERKGTLTKGDGESPVLGKLARRIEVVAKQGQLQARGVANILWALAKLFVAIPVVLLAVPSLARAATDHAKGMNAQELANSIWATAELQDASPGVLRALPALVAQVRSTACEMKPQELSNVLLAATKLRGVRAEVRTIVAGMVAEMPVKVGDMSPQHLSNSLWAAAQLQGIAPKVLKLVPVLVEQIPPKAGAMTPQGLCKTLWAAAQLQEAAPEVLRIVPAVATRIAGKAPELIPQGVSSSLWAAAKLQDAVPEVVHMVPALVAELPGKVQMESQALSNCLFAVMRLEDVAPEVLLAVPHLVKEVPKRIGSMNPQELAKTLEAMVLLEDCVPIPELPSMVAAAAARLKQILPKLEGLNFTVPPVVWACAKTETYDPALLAAVAKRFASDRPINLLPAWNLCALTWAYRKLDQDVVFGELVGRLEAAIARRGLREEEVLA